MKTLTIGAICEGNPHHLGVGLGLLHTVANGEFGHLSFYNGDGGGAIIE